MPDGYREPQLAVHPLAVRATMPTAEFPIRETTEVCASRYPRELRDAELALQFYYDEQAGKIRLAPPRSGIEIRRDIRRVRIRVRGLRRRLAA